MKQFLLFFLSVIVLIGLGNTHTIQAEVTEAEDELNLYAQSAVLMDGDSGRILYAKNENLVRPMASTTKIMTCIIALEYGNLSDTVTASANAASQPEVHLGVRKGEIFKLEDLLYSLMLESHNDTAVMIAEHVGENVDDFAALMNQKARDLGCTGTYFITPNGLDASEEVEGETKVHATTAEDLCRIMNYCIGQSPQKKEFLKITGTQSYYFTDLEGHRSFQCTNHNALLTMLKGAFSGKTGFTGDAGYSYVGAVEDEGRIFTIALLGCGWPPHKTYKWSDARKLLSYGTGKYHYKEVYEERVFTPIPVENAIPPSGNLSEEVRVCCTMETGKQEKSLKLLMSDEEQVSIFVKTPKSLKAPVEKGQCIGTVTYCLEDKTVKIYPVFLTESVEKISREWCFKNIISKYLSMEMLPSFP